MNTNSLSAPRGYIIPDLSPREAAQQLNCSVPTIYKLLQAGKLASYKVGKSRRLRWESIEKIRNGK